MTKLSAYCTGGNGTEDAARRMFEELYPQLRIVRVENVPENGNPYRYRITGVLKSESER